LSFIMSTTHETIHLKSGDFQIQIPTAFGPRVLDARWKGSDNLLFVASEPGLTAKDYHFRGGHRQWAAPEDPVRSTSLDNTPLHIGQYDKNQIVLLTADTEHPSQIRKTWEIRALPDHTFELKHTMENAGVWDIETAVWTITQLVAGGVGIFPFPELVPHGEALLPAWSLVPWTYTDLSKPCFQPRPGYMLLDLSGADVSQKIGITDYPGWSLYWNRGAAFVKYAPVIAGARYPDRGCCFESYLCPDFIELETLAPWSVLRPGQSCSHTEYWTMIEESESPQHSEAAYRRLRARVEAWIQSLPTPVS
jgi:hypothetical protein